MLTQSFAPRTTINGFDIIDLPFADGGTSMVLMLPLQPSGPNLLTSDTIAQIDNWVGGTEYLDSRNDIDVFLPKFETTVETSLNQLLIGLGMPTAFTNGAADFSAMTSEPVFIKQVFHKATIEVTEQGTTAAAATEIELAICFAAGTPVLTPDGEKPIEQLKMGDIVLARDQHNLEGPLESKVVEGTRRGQAEIVELHLGGRVIRTTGPHLFFVHARGWTPAEDIQPGDRLSTRRARLARSRSGRKHWRHRVGLQPAGRRPPHLLRR